MTPVELANLIRLRTRTNSTTFIDADILTYVNTHMDSISAEIIKANEDYFGFREVRNLEANKRNYSFDAEMLSQMKYLQMKIDEEWFVLKEKDINYLGINTDETSIQNAWKGKDPAFLIFGKEIILLTEDAIVYTENGLNLWSIVYPNHLTSLTGTTDFSVPDSTVECGFPRQFHELLATAVVIDWKDSQDNPIPLTAKEADFNNELIRKVNSIKGMNLDRSIEFNPPYDDGFNY